MTEMTKRPWKAWLLLLAVCLAGALVGGALAGFRRPMGPGRDANSMVKHLTEELDLSPVQQDSIKAVAKSHPTVKLYERNFKLWDLWDKDIVLLATDNRSLHEAIKKLARTRRILTNVADTPDLCDFYLGSVVTKGNLKIGVSTMPGATAPTRTPNGANSRDQVTVFAASAAFADT